MSLFLKIVLGWVEDWLVGNGLDNSACVKQLTKWITDGTFDDALAADPKSTIACTVEAIARVLVIVAGKMHDHDSSGDLVFGSEAKCTDEEIGQVLALGDALGVDRPMSASPDDPAAINPALIAIILELIKLFLRK